MKIVVDARCVFRGKGGIGRYAQGLLDALAWSDMSDELVVLFSGVAPSDDLDLPDRVACFAVPAAMIDEMWDQLHLPAVLVHLAADIYFNPAFGTPVLATCRRVATIHDVVFERHPELVEAGLRRHLQRAARFTVDHADRILTVSEFSKREIGEVYGVAPERVRVVCNGIDPRFHPVALSPQKRASISQDLKLPQDTPFLLYVGAIEPKKNIENLLRAYAGVRERIPHRLVLAGGQGGMPWDPGLVIDGLRLADSVRVVGYVPDEKAVELMNLADGFVYPSLYEGFGLPPLEAMACGTPTLVSSASSLPEVVGDGALVADPRDVEELGEGIVRLATDEGLRAELTARGRQRASQFTWERAARELLAVFAELAAETGGTR
jgi:glycosyltransferase involved in cell wall biosynthesis